MNQKHKQSLRHVNDHEFSSPSLVDYTWSGSSHIRKTQFGGTAMSISATVIRMEENMVASTNCALCFLSNTETLTTAAESNLGFSIMPKDI